MQSLLRTLFDISLLRKGPADLPYSWIVLFLCIGLWLFALFATTAMIVEFDAVDAGIAVGSAAVGTLCDFVVLVMAGFGSRLVQTLSALIGCGAIISIAMLALLVLGTPFLGTNIAVLGVYVMMVWSLAVKGHIIARAIERPLFAGIVIALAIFLLQLAFIDAMTPEP